MSKIALSWFGRSVVVVMAALSGACADGATVAPIGTLNSAAAADQ